jgi:hypothetical protein
MPSVSTQIPLAIGPVIRTSSQSVGKRPGFSPNLHSIRLLSWYTLCVLGFENKTGTDPLP